MNIIKTISDWLSSFKEKALWQKIVLIAVCMIVMFGITYGICFILKELIWVMAAIVAVATGIFVWYKTKKDK